MAGVLSCSETTTHKTTCQALLCWVARHTLARTSTTTRSVRGLAPRFSYGSVDSGVGHATLHHNLDISALAARRIKVTQH